MDGDKRVFSVYFEKAVATDVEAGVLEVECEGGRVERGLVDGEP